MTWARICFLLVLLDSWLYLITSGVLLYGAPHRHGPKRCSVGILLCLLLYNSSKGLVYLFLIERVRVVWNPSGPRWCSPVYILCVLLLLPLFGVLSGVMIPRAVHYVHNGYCVLGINRISSVFLLTYDICVNLFLTGMFVVPLIRSTIRSTWLKTVAIRSSVASVMALITTSTNIAVSYVLDGKEAIWVCLGGCATDLVINAIILYWAIQGPDESSESRDKSIYTSPIGDITFRWGVADGHDQLRSPGSSLRDNVSEATVAVPTMSLPPLEKPGPLIRPERSRASL
ncbi:unnamed protein product [Rhizoctonia solani]|uniref:Transmembrane protein n=1 Tax=Rhizoctonia solani TaxID=456999 RepID=A0A8H2XIC7_9AGAM|nr:unnamed protein product [Rhizoctonia solani]